MKKNLIGITLIGFVITVGSFVLALLVLPPEHAYIGYIVTSIVAVSVAFFGMHCLAKVNSEDAFRIKTFHNRDDLLHEWPYNKIVLEDSIRLCILGGTLREFINDEHLGYILEFLKNKNSCCKILIQNPASQGSYVRSYEEGRPDTIYSDIYLSMEYLLKFLQEVPSEYGNQIEVKKYSNMPSSSMFITDKKIAYTYYLYETRSSKSLWYLLHNSRHNKHIQDKLKEQFNKIWEDSVSINELDNFVILFEGLPGVGKTHTAKELALKISNSKLISSKQIRMETGLKDIFSEDQKMSVYDIILNQVSESLYRGERRIIIDGNFLKNKQRDKFFSLFKKLKVDVYYFNITANHNDIVARINEKLKKDELYRELNISTEDVLNQVNKEHQKLTSIERTLIDATINYNTSQKELKYDAKNYVVDFYSDKIRKLLIETN